jgi:hypothetical protein
MNVLHVEMDGAFRADARAAAMTASIAVMAASPSLCLSNCSARAVPGLLKEIVIETSTASNFAAGVQHSIRSLLVQETVS